MKRRKFSEVQKRLIACKQSWKCPGVYCLNFAPLSAQWELDHIIPLSAGGPDDLSNLQILCANCHAAKTQEERMRFFYEQREQKKEEGPPIEAKPRKLKFVRTPAMYYDKYHAKWTVHSGLNRAYFPESKLGFEGAKLAAQKHLESFQNKTIA